MKNNDKILMITYFYGTQGCCPAEWADDKLDAMCKMDKNTILLTSIFSKQNNHRGVKHYRIPSLSIQDLKHEMHELKQKNMPIPYLQLALWSPFIITLGWGLDMMQKIFTSGNGGGKWSWTFPASIVALYLAITHNCKKIFTTGGPASAHLAGVFVNKLTGKVLVCELQDPLTGKDIGRTANSARMLGKVEEIIMKNANKVVFVTQSAADYAKSKYTDIKAETVSIYPGSKFYTKSKSKGKVQDKLKMIHLGTLYSTRNLNMLIQAIDELIDEGSIQEGQIEIFNLGEIYGDIKDHHLSKSYIKQEGIKPREEAISIASEFDISLLVQHSDSRSEATIPYKTYDYINIGNPILALTNSNELSSLLIENGHISVDVNDVNAIKHTLMNIVNNYQNIKNQVKPLGIDIIKQTKKIMED